jgi:putative Holliday junction resolvase
LEIFEVDERLTTVSADRLLNETNKKGTLEKRKVVDKVAAAIILQTFLDRKK